MSAKHPEATSPAPVSAAGVETPRKPRKSRRWLALGIVPVLVAAAATTAHAHKSVEIEINGESHELTTFAGSVAGFLDEQGIVIGEHDLLAPDAATALTDGTDIVVRTARPVTVEIDGVAQEVWTTEQTSGDMLAGLFESGRTVSLAASRSNERSALPLVVDGEVDVVADGATTRVTLPGLGYVSDALEAAGIEVGPIDEVTIAAGEAGVPSVVVARVVRGERTSTEELPFETVEQESDDLYRGQTRVIQAGAPGERTLTFSTVTVDGQEVHSAQTGDAVTTEPVQRIVAIGTAERPAPAPAPAPTAGSAPAAPAAPVAGDVWAALAQCESGGNPTIVSSNGLYHGLYQFSVGTWQSVGGAGLPSQASAEEQTQRAQALQARSGWGQWPYCSSKLGLR